MRWSNKSAGRWGRKVVTKFQSMIYNIYAYLQNRKNTSAYRTFNKSLQGQFSDILGITFCITTERHLTDDLSFFRKRLSHYKEGELVFIG
jgi:hypothetical protein